MSLEAQALVVEYLSDVHSFWSGPGERQAKKLDYKMHKLCRREGTGQRDIIDRILSWGELRLPDRPAPVYVTGLGGSGSHWLAGMLGDLEGFVDAGEVYFSELLMERMEGLSESERGFVVDCIHLMHAWAWQSLDGTSRIVNSAAGAHRIPVYKSWDRHCLTIHLHRDPGDQCMSVTFRKPEYRKFIAPEASDYDYLRDRAQRNARHFARYETLEQQADVECRYEDLRRNTLEVMTDLLSYARSEVSSSQMEAAVDRHSAEAIRSGNALVWSNLDEGGVSRSWHITATSAQRRLLHAELLNVFHALGYNPGECLGEPTAPYLLRESTRIEFPPAPAEWGKLYLRSSASQRWQAAGPATGTIEVPAGAAIRLCVSHRLVPNRLADIPGELLSSLCLAGHPDVTDDVLGSLSVHQQLQELDLARTRISDAGLPRLAGLNRLKGVSLYGTSVSRAGTAGIDALAHCDVLD